MVLCQVSRTCIYHNFRFLCLYALNNRRDNRPYTPITRFKMIWNETKDINKKFAYLINFRIFTVKRNLPEFAKYALNAL